ncbi:hypothetical protein GGI21_004772 [Coemansia aciculifera]|nr:hypothetical protein GGI21_004772 [Coemansia aciculifera]
MPRAVKERTKYHAAARTVPAVPAAKPDAGNIVSAPVLLDTSATQPSEKDSGDASTQQLKSKRAKRADRRKKWMDQIGAAQIKQKLEKRQQGRSTNKSALIRGMTDIQFSLKEVQAELIAQHLLSLGTKKRAPLSSATVNNASSSLLHMPKSRKARDKAAISEEKRFGQILLHPAFKANPLATIRQHLANTLPQQQQQQPTGAAKK